jgi:hypothetical protein
LRAGIVSRPEDYRWNSLGYHVQTNNRDNFLSTDFGLKEFNVKGKKECIRRYRRYVYEAGAINRPDKMQAKVIDDNFAKAHYRLNGRFKIFDIQVDVGPVLVFVMLR